MGLDYSFVVVSPTDRVNILLRTISGYVSAEDSSRLQAALPWTPSIDRFSQWRGQAPARDRRGFSNLPRYPHEVGDNRCFTFLFPPDDFLVDYERLCSSMPRTADGRVAVGCVWCCLSAGEALAVFNATAATSDMSRLFERSPGVRSLWSKISIEATTTALLFDFEDIDRWELLYPRSEQVPRLDEEYYELEDGYNLNIDAYFGETLRRAGIQP